MMLSSLLDVINKRIRENKPVENFASIDTAVAEFIKLASVAEKFDFGLLPCEYAEAKKGVGFDMPWFRLPELTDEEMKMWFEGLIPLPADVCWYEFQLSTKEDHDGISGIIIKKDADGEIWTQRVEGGTRGDHSYMIDGTWSRVAPDETLRWYNNNKQRFRTLNLLDRDQLNDILGSAAMITVYLTLMINSKTTEVRKVKPTHRQQSLRKQLRKMPLPQHTIVTIVPQRFIDEARELDGDKGTHASPRIHWRRSHVRIIHRGLHNEKKIVIARMIVGRRELGEVKHDYAVRIQI